VKASVTSQWYGGLKAYVTAEGGVTSKARMASCGITAVGRASAVGGAPNTAMRFPLYALAARKPFVKELQAPLGLILICTVGGFVARVHVAAVDVRKRTATELANMRTTADVGRVYLGVLVVTQRVPYDAHDSAILKRAKASLRDVALLRCARSTSYQSQKIMESMHDEQYVQAIDYKVVELRAS